jgi:hypothetical protein
MFLETLTIDQLMDTLANWDNWEGEVVSVTPIPPAICYDEAPESQNDANLDATWEDDSEGNIPNWCYVGKMVNGQPTLYPAKQVWGE